MLAAFIKNDEAIKRTMEIELAHQVAIRNAEEAARQRELANRASKEAMVQQAQAAQIAQELANCKNQ